MTSPATTFGSSRTTGSHRRSELGGRIVDITFGPFPKFDLRNEFGFYPIHFAQGLDFPIERILGCFELFQDFEHLSQ